MKLLPFNQSGMSLISNLIAVSLVSISAAGFMNVYQHNQNSRSKGRMDLDRVALQNYFLNAVDCDHTLDASGCLSKSQESTVDLYQKQPNGTHIEILPKDGSDNRKGDFVLKAVCDPGNLSVKLLATRAKDNAKAFDSDEESDFLQDPVTGKVIKWSSPEANLYKTQVPICANPGRIIPNTIECTGYTLSSPTKAIYHLEARYGSNSTYPMWDDVIVFQGPSNSWPSRITYRRSTGAIVGYVLAKHCHAAGRYCNYPSSGNLSQIADGDTPFTLYCPPKLSFDGRNIQRR